MVVGDAICGNDVTMENESFISGSELVFIYLS